MATRSTKTATAKTTVAKARPTQKPVKAAAPTAKVVETIQPVIAEAPIKKPELVDRVVAETGMKKKDVKPVVEGMLAVLGRALRDGEEITAQPMGKLMIKNSKDLPNAKVLTLKLRTKTDLDTPR